MALLGEFIASAIGDGRPDVPAFVPVDAQAQQRKAIAGNAAALPAAMALGSSVNAFTQAELDKMWNTSFGGYYDKIRSQIGKNTTDMISGRIPTDVQNAIQSNAAVRSLYGGYGGSGLGRNLVARDLGLTSLDLMTRGVDSATRWMAATRAPQFDVTSMFISPTTQLSHAVNERNAKFQREYVENQWDWYDSFGQQMIRFEDTVVQLAAAVGGAMMGACWVAREVYGVDNPMWLLFRDWMLNRAPRNFRDWYLENGESYAESIKHKPAVKNRIRKWMDSVILMDVKGAM